MTLLTPSQGFDTEPAWSPNGKRVAFVRGGAVKVVRFPDGKDVPLAKVVPVGGTYAVNKIEFSRDGSRLLGAFRVGSVNRLAWLDLESGELTPLTPVSGYFRFALSPDGKWIVHTAMPDQQGQQSGNDGSHTDLWKLSAEGKQPEKLCRLPGRVHDLCWADAGRSLIVAAELGQAHDDLWKLPLDNPLRGMAKLTSGQADEDRPSVSRDGKWLVWTDNRGGATALTVREMASGEEAAVRFDKMDYRRPTGTLRLKVSDKTSGKPTIARISPEKTGTLPCPGGKPASLTARHRPLLLRRNRRVSLPAGVYRLKVIAARNTGSRRTPSRSRRERPST
jgi:Tol biopolymer transport system component